ncbi:MAG: NAD(P)-binding domain-containing protein, partial [Thermoplasmata archaeon]
ISRGKVSISAIAADIAKNNSVSRNILIIGTGMMGSEILRYAREIENVSITVAGRNIDHAIKLAGQYSINFSDLSDVDDILRKNDVIITAVSAKSPIITKKNAVKGKVFIDVGNPPNVDPDVRAEGIKLYSLNEIMDISKKSVEEKAADIKEAEKIIQEEEKVISLKLKEMMVDDIFSDFYKFAESVQKREIERYISENGGNYEDIYAMTHSIVNKIMNIPVTTLKSVVRDQDSEIFSMVFKDFYDRFETVIRSAFESYEDLQDTQSLRSRTRQLLRKS